jgi:hypothetical protein
VTRWVDVELDLRREFPTVIHQPLQFGAHVGSGWVTLLRELCDELEPLFAEFPEGSKPAIVDVKQKMGMLRVNVVGGNRAIHNAVMKYEAKSESVCETCGLEGSGVNERGFMSVMCDRCRHA